MAFAAIYVPEFMVQAVVREKTRVEPGLRGLAIALIDGNPPLWSVVAAVSYTHLDVYKRQVLCELSEVYCEEGIRGCAEGERA